MLSTNAKKVFWVDQMLNYVTIVKDAMENVATR